MGPGAHKTRALIGQPRQFDLKLALARAGSAGEDFKDQAGPVDDLTIDSLFQIALLHRRQGVINDNDIHFQTLGQGLDLLDLALAEQHRGHKRPQRRKLGADHVQIKGERKAHSLLKPRLGRPNTLAMRPQGVNDQRPFDDRAPVYQRFIAQSSRSPSAPGS